MKKNVGKKDKVIRLVLGVVIIIFGITANSWWGLIGAGIIIPAILSSDPLYSIIGVNTNK
jgi:hypothetical protein